MRVVSLVLILLQLGVLEAAKPKKSAPAKASYENFSLPQSARQIPSAPLQYQTERVQLRNRGVKVYEPSVNHQQFVFAREAFLAEKRDEAIKLLRQELDSGFTKNRDNLLLRLGQLYAEKYMELSYRENEVYTQELTEFEKKKTGKEKPPKLNTTRSQRYLKDALSLFTNLEKEFPRHPKMDEVIFFIGFVEMEYGNLDKGQKYLERLVKEFPSSRKHDEAVLYLGDHYFEKHKFKEALVKYRMLAARKDSPLHHYARYKIAWCQLNTGEQAAGLSEMKKLVNQLKGETEVAKFNLREQALKDLVIFYGELGQVEEAVAYFTDTVGKEKAYENLKLIADLLKSKARDAAAIDAYTRLIEEFGDSLDAPRYYLGLFDSQSRLGRTDKSVVTLSTAIARYGTESEWAKKWAEKEEMKYRQDELRTESEKAAFFFHQAGQKSSNRGSYQAALTLYKVLLQSFPNSPEKKKIAYYQAEIFFAEGKWLEAANSYMVGAQTAPKDKLADECAYNALLALDRLTSKNDRIDRISKEDASRVDTTPQEIPANEKRFLEVATFYMKEYPQGQRIVEVKFRMASIYYQYHHYDDAIERFKEIALKHPKHKSAMTAAGLSLDILNIKKDYAGLDTLAGQYAKVEGLGDAQFKKDMAQVSSEIAFKKIEKLEADNQWKEAADTYFKFYKDNSSSPLAEKALYNAFVSYEKANETALAAETSRVFVAKFPNSTHTQTILLGLAKNSEKRYDFEEAQRLYADFHKKFPTAKESRKALYNAAVFAELTEKNAVALELYENYLKDKDLSEDERKAILISTAKLYRKTNKWDKVTAIYRRLARDAKTEELRLAYLGELGRLYEKGGKTAERNQILNEIRYAYENNKSRNIGPAIQFVAEARFRAVAPQREKYEKIELRFPPEDFVYLLRRKQKALLKLSGTYDQVVEVGVPDWGVAALYEKGEAYANLVSQFQRFKIPAKYKAEERAELEKQLKVLEAQLIKPVETKVHDIFKSCVAKASQYYVANDYAVKCRERMGSTTPTESKEVVAVEPSGLIPQPSYWTTRFPGQGVAKR